MSEEEKDSHTSLARPGALAQRLQSRKGGGGLTLQEGGTTSIVKGVE